MYELCSASFFGLLCVGMPCQGHVLFEVEQRNIMLLFIRFRPYLFFTGRIVNLQVVLLYMRCQKNFAPDSRVLMKVHL